MDPAHLDLFSIIISWPQKILILNYSPSVSTGSEEEEDSSRGKQHRDIYIYTYNTAAPHVVGSGEVGEAGLGLVCHLGVWCFTSHV